MKKVRGMTNRIIAMLMSGMLGIGAVPGTVLASDIPDDIGQTSEIAAEVPEGADTEKVSVEAYDEDAVAQEEEAEVQYYTVTLDANGGYFENEWDDVLGETVEQEEVVEKRIPVGETVDVVPVFTETDQDGQLIQTMAFAGWSLEKDGELITKVDEEYAPVDNCVLYAVWGYEDAAEDADAVEGTDENEFEKDSSDLDASDTSNAEEEADLESEIEEAPTDETVEDDNAKDAEVTYTVTFDANGGYFENERDDVLGEYVERTEILNKVVPAGESIASFPVCTIENSGFAFSGWSLERDGEPFANGYDDYYPEGSCKMYAKWEAVNENVEKESSSNSVDSDKNENDTDIGIEKSNEYDESVHEQEQTVIDDVPDDIIGNEIKQAENEIVYSERALNANETEVPVLVWNGHTYRVIRHTASFADAKEECESIGGHLAVIMSAEENAALTEYLCEYYAGGSYMIGLYDENGAQGQWDTWVTGEKVTYENWGKGQPDWDGQNICAINTTASSSYGWDVGEWDNGWDGDYHFICEWDYILGLTMELSSRDKEKIYTGSEIKPIPTVRSREGKILTIGKDYTLSYENNIDPGLAAIIATGTGDYEGQSASISFKILDKVYISLDSEIEGIVDEDLPISAEIKSGHFVPSSSNMSWSVTGPEGSEANFPEIGPMSIVTNPGNTFILSSIFNFPKAGEYIVTLSSDQGDSASATITVTPESVLKITQPAGGKQNYSYAGDVQAEKQFSMTLDKVDKQPKASDFHFSVKKSDDLRNKPTNEVSGSNAEVKSIKKAGDRKYEIYFSYKPDDTGLYGLTVTYKDNKDDTELMVYDSQLLDKLEKDFNKEIKKYFESYGKRLKSEANSLRKEDNNSIDYLLLAKDLKKDSSNILTGSGIGDLGAEKVDVDSLDDCAYEALARYLQKAGTKAGVKFGEVDNDTAASMIVQRIANRIIKDDNLKNVTLDSKATLGGNKYTVKVKTNIYPGNNGSVSGQINLFVQTQDRGEKSYSYYVNMGNERSVETAVADFLDALNDLNIDAQKNVADQWYEELKDLLEWDFISDIEKSKEEYFEGLSEDIAGGLERHGLTKIIDKIKVYRNYYKKYTGIIEKIKKAKTVLKKGLSGELTSLSEIESIEINSGESGEYSKEIYDLMIKAEGKWKEYMKEYFTTGTIQDLETDNFLDTCKNGIKSRFMCPVSITVIDPSGNEVGYVGDDDIWFDDPVFIEEEGDSKIIYTPKTAGYHFDVVGTDYGLVSYTVSELTDGNPSEGYLNYYDIPVEEGTHIYIETLSNSIQSEEDIKVVCKDEAYEPETAKISSTVQVSLTNDPEKGTVNGEGIYRVGDKVTVKAFPAEDYYFAGWYEEDDFKSLSDEYQFEVRRDIVLTAAYALKADLLVSDDKIEILKQGSCGNSAVWTFDSSGTFRVSGKGQMTDYTFTDYMNGKIPWDSVKGEVERVIIEDGITNIGDQSFFGFLNLESVTVPESVRSLGDYSFGNCSSLKEINLPDTITYISDCAFVSSGLQEIKLPASCTHIGLCAFDKCKDLVKVEFCSAPYMETNVFQSCENLQEVILKTGTEKIYQGTFHSCKGLRRIIIPKGTTAIEKAAFMLDTSLTDIYIPGSVSEIDTEAFSGANKALVFHCERGSKAEKFAIEKGFSYDDSIYGHEHQYIKKVIQPTCTKKGHTVYNCDLCDVSYEDEYVEALGHSWLNWTISGEGIKSRVCARCGMEETESPRKNIADAVITGIKDTVYKGKTVTYTPKVRFGTKLLEEGTDYDLSFSDNENVGTAVAVITGIGSYKGTTVRQFEIRPKEITPDLSLDKKTFTYNGKVQKPAITVKDGDNVLTASDYTVIYPSGCINAGSYELTVKMKGNYTGVKTAAFKINKTAQTITVKAGVSSFAVDKTTSVSITGNKGTKSYKSSNTAIATVSSTGKVTARKVGTVKITATSAATANYNSASKTVTIKVVPAATASLTAANQPSGIKLTWKKVTGANGYKVYRGSTLIKTITSGSTVTYADTAANTNGTKYTYKLVAKASTGDSNLSKSVAVYRIARPALASVTNSAASKMTVKWGKNAKAAVYHIQYSMSSTFASGNKAAIIAGASTVSYDIGGLTKGKTYYVRIRTYMIVGNILYWSEWSPVKSVKISK